MIAFDGVGRVNKPADFLGILKIAAQVGPVLLPGTDHDRVFLVPFCSKVFKFHFCLFKRLRLVYKLQVGKELLLVLARDILERVPNLVHYAKLHIRFGEHGVYCVREALQAVDAGDKDVLDSAILEVGKHTEPEVRPLTLRDVRSKKILAPVAINAENVVDGTGHDSAFLVLHLVMDGVEPDDRIDVFEAAVAPGLDFRPDLVRDVAYGFCGDGAAVVFLDKAADVTGALPCGVQADNLVGQAFCENCFALLELFLGLGHYRVKSSFVIVTILSLHYSKVWGYWGWIVTQFSLQTLV